MARVLILASFSQSLKNFRGRLIEDLCANGHEVHVAAPGLGANEETLGWLRQRGVVCHDVPLARTGLNPMVDLRSLISLARLMRQIRPDVFLGYTIKPVIWGLLAARLRGVSRRVALITGLGYAFTGEQRGLRGIVGKIARLLYGLALRQATLVFFQNPDDRDDFTRLRLLSPRTPIEMVAGSGVDIEHFAEKPLPSGPPRFLLIARLLGDKGIREYAKAAQVLRARWPGAEFHLVGGVDSSPDGIPEAEVALWHSDGHIVWHGHLPDVRAAIADSHVYVLPSYREGTPRTVLEAMAMRRAVVTTDAPGCRQTVQPGRNGFLVPVRNVRALADAMERFLRDPTLIPKMGAEARRVVEERFDVRLVNAAMLKAMDLT
jgi:glycosyltransferase involved in cell wall biosynthesis